MVSIGIDIGGTKVAVGAVDEAGKIVAQNTFPTLFDPQKLADAIATTISEFSLQPKEVGVGLAGQILEGVVSFAPNLHWNNVPFQQLLHQRLQLPVSLLNDVRAATWGEWIHGAGHGVNDLVCLFIGTGIGGGIVSGGQMLTGAANCAGELGHMTVLMNGPLCHCGNRGCLEALASGWALAAQAKVDTHQLLAATDSASQQLVNQAIEALIAGSTAIVNALNPSLLILGGGLGHALPHLVERVEAGLQKTTLPTTRNSLKLVYAQLKNSAGLIGAASYARRSGQN